jgi:hypothetical protein
MSWGYRINGTIAFLKAERPGSILAQWPGFLGKWLLAIIDLGS